MQFTDTHTHLYDEAFKEDADAAIQRAIDAGVTKMIFPDIDALTREEMFRLSGRYPENIFPALGLHPTSVGKNWEEEFEKMLEFKSRKIFAIGETGIDLYWSKEFAEQQKNALEKHFQLAHEMDLPLIIHSREATQAIFDVMDICRHMTTRGVFHAFSGSIETFKRLQGYGNWYIGIGGVLTYKKASIAETIKDIPLERIILETDSPYLTPSPYRGKRNESCYIPIIANKIAEIKGCTIGEVAEITTNNAAELFRI